MEHTWISLGSSRRRRRSWSRLQTGRLVSVTNCTVRARSGPVASPAYPRARSRCCRRGSRRRRSAGPARRRPPSPPPAVKSKSCGSVGPRPSGSRSDPGACWSRCTPRPRLGERDVERSGSLSSRPRRRHHPGRGTRWTTCSQRGWCRQRPPRKQHGCRPLPAARLWCRRRPRSARSVWPSIRRSKRPVSAPGTNCLRTSSLPVCCVFVKVQVTRSPGETWMAPGSLPSSQVALHLSQSRHGLLGHVVAGSRGTRSPTPCVSESAFALSPSSSSWKLDG